MIKALRLEAPLLVYLALDHDYSKYLNDCLSK